MPPEAGSPVHDFVLVLVPSSPLTLRAREFQNRHLTAGLFRPDGHRLVSAGNRQKRLVFCFLLDLLKIVDQAWSLDILRRKISLDPIGLHRQGAIVNNIPNFQVATISLEVA